MGDVETPVILPHGPQGRSAVVYVVDDEPSLRDLMRRIVERLGYRYVGCATAQELLAAFRPEEHGCLVIDMYLPDMHGMELLDLIVAKRWRIPIICISGRAQFTMAVHAFKSGSIDFLEKPFTVAAMEQAIERALAIDRKARERDDELSETKRRLGQLTPRERQVMELVVAGRSNRLIATELGLSTKTVEVHRANVMHKMAAASLADLVKMVYAERAGEPAGGLGG
jgi:FixJ family two-component response regulator